MSLLDYLIGGTEGETSRRFNQSEFYLNPKYYNEEIVGSFIEVRVPGKTIWVIMEAHVQGTALNAVRGRAIIKRSDSMAVSTRVLPDVKDLGADLDGEAASCMGGHEYIILGPGEIFQPINVTWGAGETSYFGFRYIEVYL